MAAVTRRHLDFHGPNQCSTAPLVNEFMCAEFAEVCTASTQQVPFDWLSVKFAADVI